MNEPASQSVESPKPPAKAVLFAPADPEKPGGSGSGGNERNWLPWIVAAIAIAAVVVGLAFFLGGHREVRTASGIDPYAAHLAIRNVQISQATNFAGDQLTYVDGTVSNQGDKTVTAVSVRVFFANDDGEQPQTKQVPVMLIRARQPYVDTEPVSAAPLKPGASREFRLIFDDVSTLWNQQIPKVKVASISTYP
jgi:hypothetical protein